MSKYTQMPSLRGTSQQPDGRCGSSSVLDLSTRLSTAIHPRPRSLWDPSLRTSTSLLSGAPAAILAATSTVGLVERNYPFGGDSSLVQTAGSSSPLLRVQHMATMLFFWSLQKCPGRVRRTAGTRLGIVPRG